MQAKAVQAVPAPPSNVTPLSIIFFVFVATVATIIFFSFQATSSNLNISEQSDVFFNTVFAVCLAATLPAFVEFSIEIIFGLRYSNNPASNAHVLSGIMFFLYVIPSILGLIFPLHSSIVWVSAVYIQLMAFCCVLLSTVITLGASSFWGKISLLATIICIYSMLSVLDLVVKYSNNVILRIFTLLGGFILFLSIGSSWLSNFRLKFPSNHHDDFLSLLACLDSDNYIIIGSMVAIASGILFELATTLISVFDNDLYLHQGTVICIVLSRLIMFLCIQTLPARVVRMSFVDSDSKLHTKQSFVRHVGHEIRTPMNIVKMGFDLLEKDLSIMCNGNAVEIMDSMKSSCDVAINILNDLLLYEKIDSKLQVLEKEMFPALSFIKNVLHPFHIQAERLGISFKILCSDLGDDDSSNKKFIYIDYVKMSQVMRNFVSNALKFTPINGRVTVLITPFSCTDSTITEMRKLLDMKAQGKSTTVHNINLSEQFRSSGHLRIEIRDSGVGMTKELIGKLFREVVQHNANIHQAGGGSGLGLVISKGIVDLHGGRVGAHSDGYNKGSSFFVELPLFDGPKDYNSNKSTHSLKASENRSAQSVNDDDVKSMVSMQSSISGPQSLYILVVDDSRVTRKMMCRLLESLGHKVVEAVDGQEAVHKVQVSMNQCATQRVYDVILMDNFMPVMSGVEAARVIRDLHYRGVIFGVTGAVNSDEVQEFINSGADEVLTKPIGISSIKMALGKVPLYQPILPSSAKSASSDEQNSTTNHEAPLCVPLQFAAINKVAPVAPMSPLMVLVVDDSACSRKMLRYLVASLGHVVCEARNGLDAMTQVQKYQAEGKPFDVILMDNQMPIMNGPEATKALRALRFSGKIFGVTSALLKSEFEEFLDHGVDAVYAKPLGIDDIKNILDNIRS